MDDFSSLHRIVRTRRSIRRWLPGPVPREDLERIVDTARLAPSDTNAQPWHFTVVTDTGLIQQLERLSQQRFAEMGRDLGARGKREASRKLRVFEKYAAHFGSAPAVILVSGEPYDSRFMREVFREILTPEEVVQLSRDESIKSTALASMNLLLAAHALGYGAVPMTGPVLVIPGEIKRLFRLPDPFEPHLLVALGRPASYPATPVSRKPLEVVSTWISGPGE